MNEGTPMQQMDQGQVQVSPQVVQERLQQIAIDKQRLQLQLAELNQTESFLVNSLRGGQEPPQPHGIVPNELQSKEIPQK